MSLFDIAETTGPMTDEQIRQAALNAAADAIRDVVSFEDLPNIIGRISDEDEQKIRAEMERIADTVQRAGVL